MQGCVLEKGIIRIVKWNMRFRKGWSLQDYEFQDQILLKRAQEEERMRKTAIAKVFLAMLFVVTAGCATMKAAEHK